MGEERLVQVDPVRLLVLVKARPVIYDTTDKEHHNIEKINKLWKDIGKEMNCSASKCRMKWHSLRSSYCRYLRESKKVSSGSAAKKKKWYLADAMSFLKKYARIGPLQKTTSNLGHAKVQEPEIDIIVGDEENSEGVNEAAVELTEVPTVNVVVLVDGSSAQKTNEEMNPRKKQQKSAAEIIAQPMAEYFKAAIQQKGPEEDPMLMFLKSVLPDVNKLDDRRKRKFRTSVLKIIDDLTDEQEFGASSRPPSTSSASSFFNPNVSVHSAGSYSNEQF